MVSVVIPSYKDKYLNPTVESLLQRAEGDIEIICVMDGYWQAPIGDPRVRVIHLGKNRGMRGAINVGVQAAQGKYILRTDEHCDFGQGWDRILTENLQENWIVTPRRYYLNPETWSRMDLPPVDYCDLVIAGQGEHRKFTGRDNQKLAKERFMYPIDETFAMQGSCWIMHKSWWEKVIGELDTVGYGPLYQDSHEMVFKTWKAGGKLMVNKKTWYAHKHRDFSRTHNNGTAENPSNNEKCWAYSLQVWEEYYNELLINGRINCYPADNKPGSAVMGIVS